MGVIMHANYRVLLADGTRVVMPAPSDKATPNAPWWYDHVASQAESFKLAGFTAVLLPPLTKSQSGSAPDADGYGLFDNYDIGSKNQMYSVATRFGDDERLRRSVAIMHACGLDVYADVVLHQYDGGSNGVYEYLGADGKTKNGRFPKTPSCFVGAPPRVAADPVASTDGNFAFGDMASYVNSTPENYMRDGAVSATDWLMSTVDLQGLRVDDVKGSNVGFIHHLVTSKRMAYSFNVGEYFDGNPSALHWWVWQSGMQGKCAVFDFTLHWAIQGMCNNNSRWWMGQLDGAGYIAYDPMNAVTFVDNADTDSSYGENVIWNKLLGYALILTSEGYPCVYYKDYSTDENCYGLKEPIDNLIWIHENLAFGPTWARHGNDPQVYAYERQGYPGLLVALNNDQYNEHTITVQTSFGPNVELNDYTGHVWSVWTNEQGEATFTIPRNINGTSYVCFSRVGYTQPFTLHKRSTTQIIYGAADMSTPPANNQTVRVGRVWCDIATELLIVVKPDVTGWIASSELDLVLPGSGLPATVERCTLNEPTCTMRVTTLKAGWQAIVLSGVDMPAAGSPYEVHVTYTGTQGLGL